MYHNSMTHPLFRFFIDFIHRITLNNNSTLLYLYSNFPRTIAAMMILIIHHAELAGSHAVDRLF